jgi:hypothetical protein
MKAEPQKEHVWLQRLVGEWSYQGECIMGPGQPPSRTTGSEQVRSLGGLWSLCEGKGEMPGGGEATTLLTLGFDPKRSKFVGTFMASMMTHLWVYEGSLDATGRVLTLDTEGPSFTPNGGMARYQDIVEFEDDDRRTLKSRVLGDDGKWGPFFMTARYQRKR